MGSCRRYLTYTTCGVGLRLSWGKFEDPDLIVIQNRGKVGRIVEDVRGAIRGEDAAGSIKERDRDPALIVAGSVVDAVWPITMQIKP